MTIEIKENQLTPGITAARSGIGISQMSAGASPSNWPGTYHGSACHLCIVLSPGHLWQRHYRGRLSGQPGT